MNNRKNLLFLDSMGLVPYSRESEQEFLQRGATLLSWYSDPKILKEIETLVYSSKLPLGCFWEQKFNTENRFFIQFHKGLDLFHKKTGTDLTWLPVFGLGNNGQKHLSKYQTCLAITGAPQFRIPFSSIEFDLPYFGVNLDNFSAKKVIFSGCHEAFHAVRISFDPKNGQKTLANKFSHSAGELMFDGDVSTKLDTATKHYLTFITILEHFFKKEAFYILTRLSYEEMAKLFLDYKTSLNSPIKYLKSHAKTSLRHRIICLKLEL